MARKRPHKGNNRRGSAKGPRKQRRTITGTLRVLRPGSAVVETPEGTFEMSRSGVREAMSGDEVSVFIVGGKGCASKGSSHQNHHGQHHGGQSNPFRFFHQNSLSYFCFLTIHSLP